MTTDNDAINRRIAVEVMGWVEKKFDFQSYAYTSVWWECEATNKRFPTLPNFSTDLNHAKLAWDKLSDDHKVDVLYYMRSQYDHLNHTTLKVLEAFLDPLKLCNAILAAVGGSDNGQT